METLKLYELAEQREVLDRWLEESEGELSPEMERELDALAGKIDEKIERVGLYIRERSSAAKAIREERDRLDAAIRREERAAESLKGYLLRNMEALGKTRVNGLLVTVAIQRNSQPSVTTPLAPNELYALDDARPFVRREERVVYTLDREGVLAAWKAQLPLPAAIVVEQGSHIRVR